MIRFILVRGDVWIDDRRKKQTVKASSGLTMPFVGADCLIATGRGASATLTINGEPAELRHDSFIRIKPDGRSFLQKHKEILGKDLKLWLGRRWAEAMEEFGTERREDIGNDAVGIRG